MSDKLVLPKEVAEAIDVLRSDVGGHNLNDYGIITYLGSATQRKVYPELNVLYSYFLGLDAKGFPVDLMNALVNGYEVEKNPEEQMRKKYLDHAEMVSFYKGKSLDKYESQQERYSSGYVSGVKDFAEFYGIKIEGVND